MRTLSFYKKVFDFFLKRFQTTKGRQPMNPAEYYGIEREAVNWVNKTKGQRLPGQAKPDWHTGWTPKVIEGGKGKEGIEKIDIISADQMSLDYEKSIKDAEKQYRNDRDPKEKLFNFKRCLVHFAVDNDNVSMTTRLSGSKTRFLPYNKGIPNPDTGGYRSEYLWKEMALHKQ